MLKSISRTLQVMFSSSLFPGSVILGKKGSVLPAVKLNPERMPTLVSLGLEVAQPPGTGAAVTRLTAIHPFTECYA